MGKGRRKTRPATLKWLVRIWNAIWFLSRIVFFYIADFSVVYEVKFWDEIYWFTAWFGLLFGNSLIRHLLKFTNLGAETIADLRSELVKSGLLFVSLILWEILNCLSPEIAQSELIIFIMFCIAVLLAAWMIISATRSKWQSIK